MKVCSVCNNEKPYPDFQKRAASKDGLTAACKKCLHERDKARYPKEKDRRIVSKKRYMQTEQGKEAHKKATQRWKRDNKVKLAANVILNNAVRDGRVKRLPCFVCGRLEVQGHHPNYDAPLDVIWLCSVHHKEIHLKKV